MSLKKQFAVTLASVGLGAALIGGGTFAWFNATTEVANNTFAAGTMAIGTQPAQGVFQVSNMKPGDWAVKTFQVQNKGSLDINKVLMGLDYTINDVGSNQLDADDLAKNLKVYFLASDDNTATPFDDQIIINPLFPNQGKTLKEFKELNQVDVSSLGTKLSNLKPNGEDRIFIGIKFVDDNADQNRFQGDGVNIKFKLEGKQTSGTEK
ncbi:TasA family protein [Brevibacillus choshinensis]|uniref:Cell division protein FtsN n=1 Tax=Brevibacillus choshinensis TaxID=54911 RepID=A0ABX7FPF7_BRECH|nr:TasA family protein [Brevibacillus choshinensis]QRG68113.1 cell division protein FtsN [Brevibacillus choshinensis]